MPKREPGSSFNDQVLDEASAWFVELNEESLDEEARRRFGEWLRRSPEHVHAFLSLAAMWDDARVLSEVHRRNAALLLSALEEPAVLPFPARSSKVPATTSGWRPPKAAIAAGIACLSVCVGALAWWQLQGRYTSYVADVGERRSIALEDGSTIDLNSRSRVKVRYTDDARLVELIDGQALFHVAKDAARPFIVASDGTRVRAVGTAFDVYQKSGGTVVTVVEGRVDVSEGEITQRASAGERVVTANRKVASPKPADVLAATAWTQRKIVFDSTPLGEVIEEINRYRTRPLVLTDERLRNFHITGVFSSENPAGFIEFLRHRFDVVISEGDEQIRIESAAPQS